MNPKASFWHGNEPNAAVLIDFMIPGNDSSKVGARTSIVVSALAGGVVDVDPAVGAPLGKYREKVVTGAGRCREAVEIQRRRIVTKDDD